MLNAHHCKEMPPNGTQFDPFGGEGCMRIIRIRRFGHDVFGDPVDLGMQAGPVFVALLGRTASEQIDMCTESLRETQIR